MNILENLPEDKLITYAGAGCVSKVVDGDTILVLKSKGDQLEEICVRLIGVDAPEEGEPFYSEAKAFLEGFFENSPLVKMYFDGPVRDRYDRWRAHVYTHETSVLISEKLLEYGYARILKVHSHIYEDLFVQARKIAYEQERGKWKRD